MRRIAVPLIVLTTAVVGVTPALAADATVQARASITFSPAVVAIKPGEKVTFMNVGGGFHNVVLDDGSFTGPPSASTDAWVEPHTFAAAGRFAYHCSIHGAAGGQGMSGVVFVNARGMVPAPVKPPEVSRPGAAGGVGRVALGLTSSKAGTATGTLLRRAPGARSFHAFGAIRFAVHQGRTTATVRRTISGRALTPGAYVATVTVSDAGRRRSGVLQFRFTVR